MKISSYLLNPIYTLFKQKFTAEVNAKPFILAAKDFSLKKHANNVF